MYAARCTKHDLIYVGYTSEQLSDRFSKHRYDVKRRPDNSELASHFHADHKEEDMEVLILQSNIASNTQTLEFHEDKWICTLQTLQPTGINKDVHQYAKDMYAAYKIASS